MFCQLSNVITLITRMFLWLSVFYVTAIGQNLLNHPQEILIDSVHNRYLVSNFTGGHLVQIDSLGNQSYFVEDAGMNDAMVIVDGIVYGSGSGFNGRILGYDLDTGELVFEMQIPGTRHISGFKADSLGILFASERFGDRIFRINPKAGKYWVYAQGGGVNQPNGLFYEPEKNRLLVLIDSPNAPAYAISLIDSTISIASEAIEEINGSDGITKDKYGNYYVTGYYLPGVYKFDPTFQNSPEMIWEGDHIVYPTYEEITHSLLLPYYSDNTWSKLQLDSPIPPMAPDEFSVYNETDGIRLKWNNPSSRIDGSALDSFKVMIYRDGILLDSLIQTTADTGQTKEYFDNSQGFFSYKLQIKDNKSPYICSQFSTELKIYGGEVYLEFENDFENSFDMFYITGLWDTTGQLSSSGNYSITDSPEGDYQPNQDTYIQTPPIIIDSNYVIQFDHIGIIRIPSIGHIEISNDGGNTFTSLMDVTGYRYDEWKDWTADTGDWKNEIISLADFMGDTVMVRFCLKTNDRTDMDGWYIDNISIGPDSFTDNDSEELLQNNFYLEQNYPNPFNPTTVIKFSIPSITSFTTNNFKNNFNVDLRVYNLLGQQVALLMNKQLKPGNYEVSWNASNLSSGIYFYKLIVGDTEVNSNHLFESAKKMLLLK